MATITPQPTAPGGRKFHSLKIDMTPMVDLGFLLITFFVFTAALSQPRITRLIMPKEGEPSPVAESKTLTLLLDHQQVFAYEGSWESAFDRQRIAMTSYHLQTGMGEVIRQKKRQVGNDLVVLIKPLPSSSYQQVMEALDEMQINDVKRYAFVDVLPAEAAYAAKQ